MHTHYGIYQGIRNSAWRCLLDFHIDSLPVDIRAIARGANVRILSNQSFPLLRRTDRGMTYFTPDHRIIVYNEALPSEEIRFTVAHELGHLFLGHDLAYERYGTTRNDQKAISEKQANQFATRLLCPSCVLWALDLDTPEKIAVFCHVPMSVAKERAKRLRLLKQRNCFLTDPQEKLLFEAFTPYIESIKKAADSLV